MNAINSTLDKGSGNKVILSKGVLWNMAYGEKRTRTICPVCQKRKNFDDLACDMCVSKYGDELNKVIHNALCGIRPSKYPQKRSTSLQFEIGEKLISNQKETPIEEKIEKIEEQSTKEEKSTIVSKGNNLLEVAPGFFLHKDEIEIMAKNEFGVSAKCPICKKSKPHSKWLCFSCGDDKRKLLTKIHLIQYAVIRIRPRSNFLDGNICDPEIEQVLLDAAVQMLISSAKDFFCEHINYLKTVLKYFPNLDSWNLPIASCIISKIIFHALAIVRGKPSFQGVIVDGCEEVKIKPAITLDAQKIFTGQVAKVNSKIDSEILGESKALTEPVSLKVPVREDFLREASEILRGITDNLNEDLRAGKSLSAFLSQKVLDWKRTTGKKNPDTKDFFSKVPFSEKFLEQLEQNGNCSLKFFSELAAYFVMSSEEILAEGLLALSLLEKKDLQEIPIFEVTSEKNQPSKVVSPESTDKEINSVKKSAELGKDALFVKSAEFLLGKVQKNLKEVPLAARALWAFINETAKEKEMTIVDFGETIDIYATSLNAIRTGGNKQQCLSVSKFDQVVANLGLSKEAIIANGLKLLVQGGDSEAQEVLEVSKV